MIKRRDSSLLAVAPRLVCRLAVFFGLVLDSSTTAFAFSTGSIHSSSTTTTRTPWLERKSYTASPPSWPAATSSSLSVASSSSSSSSLTSQPWFSSSTITAKEDESLDKQKAVLLQLGAAMDRGQAYNPTSGDYYADRMEVATQKIRALLEAHPNNIPKTMFDIEGEWELVLSTVAHGIFRSSPFFLAIQESYEYAEEKEAFGMPKEQLFFKLHELQTCSWGVSKIGRVAQHITSDYLYSEFDTSIFSLTVIPILGWFKLLPTFGGCVVTAAKAELERTNDGALLKMVVEYTTARKVPGLAGLGPWIWSIKVPVGAIWKLLPWNKGREADCKVWIRYCDDDFRIVEDGAGDYFVYTRPVIPRALDLAEQKEE